MAGVAADMRAGDIELIAQEMDQQGARLDQSLHGLAIDLHRDLRFGHRFSLYNLFSSMIFSENRIPLFGIML